MVENRKEFWYIVMEVGEGSQFEGAARWAARQFNRKGGHGIPMFAFRSDVKFVEAINTAAIKIALTPEQVAAAEKDAEKEKMIREKILGAEHDTHVKGHCDVCREPVCACQSHTVFLEDKSIGRQGKADICNKCLIKIGTDHEEELRNSDGYE